MHFCFQTSAMFVVVFAQNVGYLSLDSQSDIPSVIQMDRQTQKTKLSIYHIAYVNQTLKFRIDSALQTDNPIAGTRTLSDTN